MGFVVSCANSHSASNYSDFAVADVCPGTATSARCVHRPQVLCPTTDVIGRKVTARWPSDWVLSSFLRIWWWRGTSVVDSFESNVPRVCLWRWFSHPPLLRFRSSSTAKNLLLVYTKDPVAAKQTVLDSVQQTFGFQKHIAHPSESPLSIIRFVSVSSYWLLLPRCYPVLTLLGQAVGSMVVVMEALFRCPPDIFIDTTGFGFTLPVAKCVAGSKTAAYVHYPTISSDMLNRVGAGMMSTGGAGQTSTETPYNNASWIRGSKMMSLLKLVYYHVIKCLYGMVGLTVDVVMTNSTWTANHIHRLWGGQPVVLYPPCPTKDLSSSAESAEHNRSPWLLSVGQFRPEKNHEVSSLLAVFCRQMSSSYNK